MEEKKFKLKDLLIDIDYQEKFTYEQRVDFFNKYGYSTSMLFFTPAYHLSNFIISFLGYKPNNTYAYGHGKYVLDKKLLENATENFSNPNKHFYYKEVSVMGKEYLKSATSFYCGNAKTAIQYWLTPEGELTIKLVDGGFKVPKVNIYELVDEWLINFGYK